MAGPKVSFIDSLDDERVRFYRDLKDRDLAREGGRFIAEGETVVRRLLASGYATESVLVAESGRAVRRPRATSRRATRSCSGWRSRGGGARSGWGCCSAAAGCGGNWRRPP